MKSAFERQYRGDVSRSRSRGLLGTDGQKDVQEGTRCIMIQMVEVEMSPQAFGFILHPSGKEPLKSVWKGEVEPGR